MLKTATLISILIPTYNYNCSLLVQQLKKEMANLSTSFEILIGDDASQPHFVDALKALESEQCKLILSSKNIGREANRLNLAHQANYNHLLFMDADVFPADKNFLKEWVNQIHLNKKYDVIFGGITYAEELPPKNQQLRWKYGHKYEKQSLENRRKNPYLSIVTGCLLIQKEVFIKHTSLAEAIYGLDILLSYNLKNSEAIVKHIDLPVIHQGLEDNLSFIAKIEESWKLIVNLEEKGLITKDYRSIQKHYQVYKQYKLAFILSLLFPLLEPISIFMANKKASVFWLDVYRLCLFCYLKSAVKK